MTPQNDGDEDDSGAVYAPATFQFSTESGRIERILVGLFGQRGEMEVRRVPEDEETPEFYVPAMFQFTGEKGRIERFLDAVLEERGGPVEHVPEEFAGDFYLPAADPDDYTREVGEPPDELAPATEVKGADEDDDEE